MNAVDKLYETVMNNNPDIKNGFLQQELNKIEHIVNRRKEYYQKNKTEILRKHKIRNQAKMEMIKNE